MAEKKLSDSDFAELFESVGPAELANRTGNALRQVMRRRLNVEKYLGRELIPPNFTMARRPSKPAIHPFRVNLEIQNGVVLIGSDGHYWPGKASTAHRAFVKFAKEMKPRAIIFNGDALDGASISRWPSIGWESRPSLIQEIEACQERLGEIEHACRTRRIWNLGNHDARFETRLATVAPEFAKVRGVHLKDHFPQWETAWATWINNEVVIKHRFKGGVHATHNNTVNAGKTVVTSHLHAAKVTPFSDYNGDRWGVDTGCLAEPNGKQFEYSEDNPKNHRSAFCVLTFKDGRLLQPQLALVVDENLIDYCGQLIEVPDAQAKRKAKAA